MKVLVSQSCPTHCSPMDCGPPGSSVHGFSRQEYWRGLPFPSPGDPPNTWIEPASPEAPSLREINNLIWGFSGGTSGKEPACQFRRLRFDPWVRKMPWRRKWQPTLVFLPGESMDRGAWQTTSLGLQRIRVTEWLSIHTHIYCLQGLEELFTKAELALLCWSQEQELGGRRFIQKSCISVPFKEEFSAKWNYSWPLNNAGIKGTDPSHSQKPRWNLAAFCIPM